MWAVGGFRAMSIVQAFGSGMRNYFQISGRAVRSEFWGGALCLFLVAVPLMWLAALAENLLFGNVNYFVNNYHPLVWATFVFFAIPLHLSGCRRLRDIGWPSLLTFIPLAIAAISFLGARLLSGAPTSPNYDGYASWPFSFVMFCAFFASIGALIIAFSLPTSINSNPNEVPQ